MDSPTTSPLLWEKIPERSRRTIVWALWFVTWLGLLLGFVDRRAYEFVVIFSAAHAVLFLSLHHFQVAPFPVQVRIGYLLWVLIGTYAPHMTILMYITTAGLLCNVFFRYCPLARMMYLLPWNRTESLSLNLVVRVFVTPPVEGRFSPRPPSP